MKARVDYKEILSPDEFILFAKLRDLRKEIAQTEAVPVYAVFTNEQLSQMIQQEAKSKSEQSKLEGVGESRIEKYGARILELLVGLDETGQEKP